MTAKTGDVRADLEAIAAGRTLAANYERASIVDDAAIDSLQADYRPWASFVHACRRGRGERLAAPAELLTPTP